MLMGLVLRGQKYSWQEWLCGGAVGAGASVFLLSSGRSRSEGVVTSVRLISRRLGFLVVSSGLTVILSDLRNAVNDRLPPV